MILRFVVSTALAPQEVRVCVSARSLHRSVFRPLTRRRGRIGAVDDARGRLDQCAELVRLGSFELNGPDLGVIIEAIPDGQSAIGHEAVAKGKGTVVPVFKVRGHRPEPFSTRRRNLQR